MIYRYGRSHNTLQTLAKILNTDPKQNNPKKGRYAVDLNVNLKKTKAKYKRLYKFELNY